MPDVSVVVPTYNRKDKIGHALRSIVNQEHVCFETIVVDDGSTDDTESFIRHAFPMVIYMHQKNQGPAAARNRGIEGARAPWIAFLDSDDEWLPGKLSAQMDFFKNHPDHSICQTEEIWMRRGRRVNPMNKHKKYGGDIFDRCLPLCLISPSAVIIHRSVFERVGLFDESLPACEDYDLWLRITAQYPVGLIARPYVMKHGGHDGQRSHEFPAMDRFRIQSLAKVLSSGTLSLAQRKSALRELKLKSRIYLSGAEKRGRNEEIARIRSLVSQFDLPDPVTFIGTSASQS